MKSLTFYYLKKRLSLFLIVLGISIIASITYLGSTDFVREIRVDGIIELVIRDDGLEFVTIILLILATIIPIYEFSFKMKKRSCDLFYSLPIKRNKLYIFKYVFGLCEMLSIFIINFMIIESVAIAKISGKEFYQQTFNAGYIFAYFGILIVIGILLYSWVTFFYTRGNTIFDGILSVLLSTLVLMAITFGIMAYGINFKWFSYDKAEFLKGYHYMPYVSVIEICSYFSNLVCGEGRTYYLYPEIITWVLALVSIVLFIVLSGKDKAESAEDISDSPFIYKVMIPLFIISLFMICEISNFSWIAVIIGGYIGYVIYNRNFLLRRYDLLVFFVSVGLGFALMMTKMI